MFALPPFRVIVQRGTIAARSGRRAPAVDAAPPPAAPTAVVAPRAADRIVAGATTFEIDPAGLRVVPLRPDSGWPQRRGYDRVASPFRAFPYRSLHLTRMMSPADPRD